MRLLLLLGIGLIVLIAHILLSALSDRFSSPLNKWMSRGRWRVALVAVAVTIGLAWSYWPSEDSSTKGLQETVVAAEKAVSASPSPTRPTFAQLAAAEQEKVDALRIGMTEEELVTRLGLPTSRIAAPANPYGISTELVFSRDLTIIQVLLGPGSSVMYYAVTARDYGLKLGTPLQVHQVLDSYHPLRRPRQFILNKTPLGAMTIEYATPFGDMGASYENIGWAWQGSHSQLWQGRALGLHMSGARTDRGKEPTGDPGSGRLLWDVLTESYDKAELTRTFGETRKIQLASCLRQVQYDRALSRAERVWYEPACEDYSYTEKRLDAMWKSDTWHKFYERATMNTFAVTAPKLFDTYSPIVFYHIFDLGPAEESLAS